MRSASKKSSLFLVQGDAFLREAKIKELLQSTGDPSVDVSTHHAFDLDLSVFFEDVQTVPFTASRKIILLKEADRLLKNVRETLLRGLETIPDFSTVILEADEFKKDEDSLLKFVSEKGTLLLLAEPSSEDQVRFVRDFAARSGHILSPDAVECLLERCAGDLKLVAESLQKITSHTPPSVPIEQETVAALSEQGFSADGFTLIEAFSRRDTAQTLAVLAELYDASEAEPIELIGTLNWHFKRVWQAKKLLTQGKTAYDICRELRIRRSDQDLFLKQTKLFSEEKLTKITDELFDLDWKIKRGKTESRTGLESFLVQFSS